MAVREVGGYLLTTLGDMLVYCSFCNATFSMNVLTQIMVRKLYLTYLNSCSIFVVLLEDEKSRKILFGVIGY